MPEKEKTKILKRESQAILNSLGAGVVPRQGLEHIAVGREHERAELLKDLDTIAGGGATFRVLMGHYGSGKSFLGHLLRNRALSRNFMVMDAEFSIERRLSGTDGQTQQLYAALLASTTTKTRPSGGGAVRALLERWLSDKQRTVQAEDGLEPGMAQFNRQVEAHIRETIDQMEGMVHSHDFSQVLMAYWRAHHSDDEELKNAVLRWFHAGYNNNREVTRSLGLSVKMIDRNWFDILKLLATFAKHAGYRGLLIFLDEFEQLYLIRHSTARHNNYQRVMAIFSEIVQGSTSYLGFVLGATPDAVMEPKKGLFSLQALGSRWQPGPFDRKGLRNFSGPLIPLAELTPQENELLLRKILNVYSWHYATDPNVPELGERQLDGFLADRLRRSGTGTVTPREIARDFLNLLDLMRQNPDESFASILAGR